MFNFFKKDETNALATMLKIDDASILKKLQNELNYTTDRAQNILKEIRSIQPRLFPLVEAWFNGDFVDFQYKGVSITSIMEKQHCNYLGAITWMNFLLKNPGMAKDFKTMEFKQR